MTESNARTGRRRDSYRYGRTNPPPSRDKALATMDDLEFEIQHMLIQLNQQKPENVGEDYEKWRKSAMTALAFSQAEFKYLQEWAINDDAARKAAKAQEALKNAGDRAREATHELEGRCRAIYSVATPPPDVTAAHNRLVTIGALRFQLEDVLVNIDDVLETYPELSGKNRFKKPLQRLLHDLDTESAYLNRYMRAHEGPSTNTEAVFVRLARRAMVHDFILTNEEQDLFDTLK